LIFFTFSKQFHTISVMKLKTRGPYRIIKNGNVSVPIYRIQNKGYTEFRVVWYDADRKRRQKAFADESEASRHASGVNATITSGDIKTITLSEKDRFSYLEAVEALKELNVPLNAAAADYAANVKRLGAVTLKEAVDFFLKHNAGIEPKTVAQVVSEFIESKHAPKRANKKAASGRYVADLESRLGKFEEAFQCNISDVLPEQIQDFLDGLPGITGRTWFNYARVVRTLMKFAQAKKYYSSAFDPMGGIEIEYSKEDDVIEIFTPEELAKLFATARPDATPFLAIGAFGGVRHAEITRLDWKHISDTHIEIEAGGAKTRSRRIIPIQPNLAKWLAPYRRLSGRVSPRGDMTELLARMADDAGIGWRHNALRHSFISYRLAETNDENRVAVEAGNSPTMIQHHYRQIKDHTGRVITTALADAWFSIAPDTSENVVPMKAA
jgi:integrase